MTFESKKIIEQSQWSHQNRWSYRKHIWSFVWMFAVWILLVVWALKWYGYIRDNQIIPSVIAWSWSTTTPAKTVWSEANTKIINALIIGVWWKGHRGAYNTDTMIVVSYNPRTKQLNMISIPRDLYVNIDKWYYGRINSILDYYMSQKKLNLDESLSMLKQKVGNLIGQDISYYGMIDFKWFEHVIDTLGGVEVDVPEELYDPSFPVDDFNYGILQIDAWKQTMDGNTALNYARSRHSTSDFDRSRRQQIVIKALLNKLLSFGSLTKVKSLYTDFQNTVTTNVWIGDVAKYISYVTKIAHLNTIVFQSDCPESLNQMKHGCVLYSPPREAFGGAAVLLPIGATPKSISDYSELFKFVNRVIYFPFGNFEWISLGIYNGIDKTAVTKNIAGFSSNLWVELIRNGLNVQDVSNNLIKHDRSLLIQLSWDINTKDFASYVTTVEDILGIWPIDIGSTAQLPLLFSGEIESGVNTLLLVWKDAILVSK